MYMWLRTKALSMDMRLAEIDQCDFAGQFRDETVVRLSLAEWNRLVRPLSQKAHAELTNQERALCSYWRSVLSTDGLFSMSAVPIRVKDVGPASFEQVLSAFEAQQETGHVISDSEVFSALLIYAPVT